MAAPAISSDLCNSPCFQSDQPHIFSSRHTNLLIRYVAHLGGPEIFGELLWSEAQARGWEQHFETQVIGDGAPWIWNLSHQHFFDSVQTVDWYHASQHLYTAAQGYYPDNPGWVQRWYDQAETTLFQGSVDKIITSGRIKDLGEEISTTSILSYTFKE